jgi:hypothetical protein
MKKYGHYIALAISGLIVVTGLVLFRRKDHASVPVALPSVEQSDSLLSFPKEINLGTQLYTGEALSTTVALRNVSPRSVTIERISRDCGCTSASVSPQIIKPGTTAVLKVDFDAERERGAVRTGLTLCGDGDVYFPIKVALRVEDGLSFGEPHKVLRIPGVRPGSGAIANSSVRWNIKEPPAVDGTCDLPFVRVTLDSLESGTQKFRVEVQPSATAGMHYGIIRFVNRKTKKAVLLLPLLIAAEGEAAASTSVATPPAAVGTPASKESEVEAKNRVAMTLELLQRQDRGASLIELARAQDVPVEVRVLAIRELGSLPLEEAGTALFAVARQPGIGSAERAAVASALRTLAGREPARIATELQKSSTESCRLMLVTALAEGQSEFCLVKVQELFASGNAQVRHSILRGLRGYPNDHAVNFLKQIALDRADEGAAYLAVEALGCVRSEESQQALRAIASSDSTVRERASEFLSKRRK